jgi:hemerythrin-like metal-binding protein
MPHLAPFQPIEWEASMATGIDAIDKQHHYLVDTVQKANKTLLTSNNDNLLGKIAKDLLGFAILHFETEEALMKRYGYKAAYPEEAQAHISQHRDFSYQIVTIRDQLREGQEISRIQVLRFLNHWLPNHLLGFDHLFGQYLREKMAHEPIQECAKEG